MASTSADHSTSSRPQTHLSPTSLLRVSHVRAALRNPSLLQKDVAFMQVRALNSAHNNSVLELVVHLTCYLRAGPIITVQASWMMVAHGLSPHTTKH